LSRPKLQNLHHRGPRGQNQRAATNFDGFEMAEAEILKDGNEATLGRRKVAGGAWTSGSGPSLGRLLLKGATGDFSCAEVLVKARVTGGVT
jgi:hypothetical protein